VNLSREVKIGILTVIAIAFFIYGFNYLKGKNYFAIENKFYAIYSDVDGLVEANPLIINGYKVGIVTEIELSNNASKSVVVTMLLDKKIKIPKNSIARVVNSDLLGSKAIQLVLGDSPVYAESGDTLVADKEENLKQSVNKAIEPLQRKAEGLISSIDSVMIVVQDILNKDARANIKNSFASIDDALHSLETTSRRLDTLVTSEKTKISSILTKANHIVTTLSDNSAQLSAIINNFSSISDSLAKANIKTTINNANFALKETSDIMKKINSGQGTIGMLVNNDSLYIKLDKSAGDLDKLLIDLKEHPKRYVHFSVFGGKEKK
jgi:phospholipid/cholesterol/gamma-HCH transport system substrate-binding protein